jgi:hypothetical protein
LQLLRPNWTQSNEVPQESINIEIGLIQVRTVRKHPPANGRLQLHRMIKRVYRTRW